MNVHRSQKASRSRTRSEKRGSKTVEQQPQLTLFTLPKPFTDPLVSQIQMNAIQSWMRLAPAAEVILFGDDFGIDQAAEKVGAIYGGPIRRNKFGTPLLSDAFAKAHELARTDVLMYSNSDIIFQHDVMRAVEQINQQPEFERFVAFGRRHDLKVDRPLNLTTDQDRKWLLQQIERRARRSSIVCKEYFIFRRGIFLTIPDFAVGRGNWDNWMIYHARSQGIPVINATDMIMALHQCHGYKHLKTSRLGCYVTCPEARENQRLAGGRHLVRGSCGTYRMTSRGILPIRRAAWNVDFWRHLGSFSKMILQMPFER